MKKIFYTMLVSLMAVIMITVIIFVSYKGFTIIRHISQIRIASFTMNTRNSSEILEGKFQIWENDDIYFLLYRESYDNKDSDLGYNILDLINNKKNVSGGLISKGWYYLSSPDGYAIIEKKTLICRVYIKPELIDDKYRYGPVDGDANFKALHEGSVIYLDSFEDFTLKEQEILKDMHESRWWDYVPDGYGGYKIVEPNLSDEDK